MIADPIKIICVLLKFPLRKFLITTISSPPPSITVVILPKGMLVKINAKPSAFRFESADANQNIPSHIKQKENSGPASVASHPIDSLSQVSHNDQTLKSRGPQHPHMILPTIM